MNKPPIHILHVVYFADASPAAMYEVVGGQVGRWFNLDGTDRDRPDPQQQFINVGTQEAGDWYVPPAPPSQPAPPPEAGT